MLIALFGDLPDVLLRVIRCGEHLDEHLLRENEYLCFLGFASHGILPLLLPRDYLKSTEEVALR